MSEIHRDRLVHPLEEAIFWIEYTIRTKGAPHLRPASHKLQEDLRNENLPLKKAGRFEKLLGFARIHSSVTHGSVSLVRHHIPFLLF